MCLAVASSRVPNPLAIAANVHSLRMDTARPTVDEPLPVCGLHSVESEPPPLSSPSLPPSIRKPLSGSKSSMTAGSGSSSSSSSRGGDAFRLGHAISPIVNFDGDARLQVKHHAYYGAPGPPTQSSRTSPLLAHAEPPGSAPISSANVTDAVVSILSGGMGALSLTQASVAQPPM